MLIANLIVVITLATLALYSTNIVTSAVSDSECVGVPQICSNILWNVTANATLAGRNDTFQQINSTLKAIRELANVQKECLSAIQRLMCINATRDCNNNTNSSTSLIQQSCMVVDQNCTQSEVVARTYSSRFCPQNDSSSNNSECLKVTLANDGYCPYNDTYKIAAENIREFLRKASVESDKLRAAAPIANIPNGTCLTEYKRIKCKTFVSTCSGSSNITKESCEQKLQCLQSNVFFNKTRLCSNFPSKPLPTVPTTQDQMVTTPYNFNMGVNTTVTIRLNTQFNSQYSNKSSSIYKSFAKDVTNGLKIAYNDITGFQGVFVVELTCQQKVAVKHTVVTSSTPNVKVMEARLILANITNGYLKGKVVEANKACVDANGNSDSGGEHTDSSNWVYMIVFVCITALLLLAMVLCHQSK